MHGDVLKKIRKEKKLTQQNIADILGVSNQYISAVEKNIYSLSDEKTTLLENHLNVKFSNYETEQEIINWQNTLNLTDSEIQLFTETLVNHKEMFLLLAKGLKGDSVAIERLKKLL